MSLEAEKLFVLIPAAGSGARLGLGRSKGLLSVGGRTAIERVVGTIAATCPNAAFVVLVPRVEEEAFTALRFPVGAIHITPGGETRQDSVHAGLKFIERHYQPASRDLVLVHDAARCLVSERLIRTAVEAGREWGAVTTAVPLIDSIVQLDAEGQGRSLPRATLRAVQTPQVFHYQILRQAHQQGAPGATDDASLVEKIHSVKVIEGELDNFKITCLADLERAEALLTARVRAA